MRTALAVLLARGVKIDQSKLLPVHDLPANIDMPHQPKEFDYSHWQYDGYGSLGKAEMEWVAAKILDHCFYHKCWVGISWYDMALQRSGGPKKLVLKLLPRRLVGRVPEFDDDDAGTEYVLGLFGAYENSTKNLWPISWVLGVNLLLRNGWLIRINRRGEDILYPSAKLVSFAKNQLDAEKTRVSSL